MAREIERKFLISSDSWRRCVVRSEHLRQGYLAATARCSVRVRLSERAAWLGLKSRLSGMTRLEFEYPIPQADAAQILDSVCERPCIEKVRHHVMHADHGWEIDEFLGENAGLIVAEIELAHEAETFERPPWLGSEITEDERYYNFSLAAHPWRRWSNARDTRT